MKCSACGRTGIKKRVTACVATPAGIEVRRVCVPCANDGLRIVFGVKARPCDHCRSDAVVCAVHAGVESARVERAADRKAAAKKIRAIAHAYRVSQVPIDNGTARLRLDARADGLEQAADILDAGDF